MSYYKGRSGKEILHRLRYSEDSPTGLVWAIEVYRKPTDTVPLRCIGEVAGYVRVQVIQTVTENKS